MAASVEEYLNIMDLKSDVGIDQLRQKYRDLIFVWHPDRFPGNSRLQADAEAKLKEINGAYEFLLGYLAAPNHDQQQSNEPFKKETLYIVHVHDRIGYINANGDVVIPAVYKDGPSYFDDLTIVKAGDSLKVIDTSNNIVGSLGSQFSRVVNFGPHYWVEGQNYNKKCLFNKSCEQITEWYDDISLHEAEGVYINNRIGVKSGDKYGVIDGNGKILLPLIYDSVWISKHFIRVTTGGEETLLRSDTLQQVKIPAGCKPYMQSDKDTHRIRNIASGKEGLIDLEGNVVIGPKYEYLYPFSCGLALSYNNQGERFINAKEETVIDIDVNKYENVGYFFDQGFCRVNRIDEFKFFGGSFYTSGLINKNGNIEVVFFRHAKRKVSWMTNFVEGNAIVHIDDIAKNEKKYGVINENGGWVLDCRYEHILALNNSILLCTCSGSKVYYDWNGNMIKLKI